MRPHTGELFPWLHQNLFSKVTPIHRESEGRAGVWSQRQDRVAGS